MSDTDNWAQEPSRVHKQTRQRNSHLPQTDKPAQEQIFSTPHRQQVNPFYNSGQQQTAARSGQAASAPSDHNAATGQSSLNENIPWPGPAQDHHTSIGRWSNDEEDRLASVHFPPASYPSYGQGYSLPQGANQPSIPIGSSSLQSTLEAESRGGFTADFVGQLADKHKCPICLLALREPVQTNCGHRFCRWCIEPIRKQQNPQCPIDKEPLQKIFPDNFCKREVLTLLVNCTNSVAGCGWRGQLRELQSHLEGCPFALALCSHWDRGCRFRVLQSKLKQHVELECEYRDSLCEHCQSTLPLKKVEAHVREVCPEVDIKCINECGATVKRKEMPEHITHVCPNTVLECQFSTLGCQFKGDRSSMSDHMKASVNFHLALTVERNSSLEKVVTKLDETVQEKGQTVARLEEKLENFERLFGEMTTKMIDLERTSEKYGPLEVRLNAFEGQVDALLATAQPVGMASNSTLSAMTKKIDEAVEMAAKAEAETSTAQQKATSVESKMASIDRQMVHVNTLIGRTDAILAEFDLRLLSQETASFGGILVWKIPDFNRHFEEARTGKKPSLYSPPFYTSRHGYKMCARVYLYGDGVGKSSHMSVFFVVMRGEFDALLAWPFHQKVTLTLLDQSSAKRNISDTFLPDPSSSSFQRPTSEMNIASGCPRFISIDTLRTANGYVKDNTIFLRIAIDCTGLPAY